MPSEVSIAKPLSGSEVLAAMVAEIWRQLGKDDRFSSHMAYTGFRAIMNINFYPQLSFVPAVERTLILDEGDISDIAESPTVSERIEMPIQPPNVIRENAGMPTPVLVTDANGRSSEKWVKRSSVPAQVGVPKNKGSMKGF